MSSRMTWTEQNVEDLLKLVIKLDGGDFFKLLCLPEGDKKKLWQPIHEGWMKVHALLMRESTGNFVASYKQIKNKYKRLTEDKEKKQRRKEISMQSNRKELNSSHRKIKVTGGGKKPRSPTPPGPDCVLTEYNHEYDLITYEGPNHFTAPVKQKGTPEIGFPGGHIPSPRPGCSRWPDHEANGSSEARATGHITAATSATVVAIPTASSSTATSGATNPSDTTDTTTTISAPTTTTTATTSSTRANFRSQISNESIKMLIRQREIMEEEAKMKALHAHEIHALRIMQEREYHQLRMSQARELHAEKLKSLMTKKEEAACSQVKQEPVKEEQDPLSLEYSGL